MEKIPRCSHCGKEFKANDEAFLKKLPEIFREKLAYIPDCKCYEKRESEIMEKLEEERVAACNKNKMKPFSEVSVMDQKFKTSTFENADMDTVPIRMAFRYAQNFIKNGSAPVGLLFFGGVGTGKTFASSCIANELIRANKTVVVLSVGLYINKLIREGAVAENFILNRIKKCELLIIDDLGVEKASEFVTEKIFSLIDTRYRAEKPVIITTNLVLTNRELKTPEDIKNGASIENRFGKRVSDRISEMCQLIAVSGESRRAAETRKKFKEFMGVS